MKNLHPKIGVATEIALIPVSVATLLVLPVWGYCFYFRFVPDQFLRESRLTGRIQTIMCTLMRAMLSVCDQFGSQYSVKFNATKSKSMQFAARGRVKRHLASRPDFCISGHSIEYADKYVHLGHVISSDL